MNEAATPAAPPPRNLAPWFVMGTLLLVVQLAQAWALWGRDEPGGPLGGVQRGALCSVMLGNGQVYYGDFVQADARHLRIENVYYVQTTPDPATGQPANRLVSRRKADWHAPQWMSIPLDKVVMVEAVGEGSRLAELVAQDRKAAGASR